MIDIICQKCGAAWRPDSIGSPDERFYFESENGERVTPTSLNTIVSLGLTMVACPKDPLPFDPSLGAPSPSTGLQPDRAPDSGERSPGRGSADTVHPPEED